MSNEIPGSAENDRPTPAGNDGTAYPSRQYPYDSSNDPDGALPEIDENDPLIRAAGERTEASTSSHPSITPTPIPHAQGLPVVPMPTNQPSGAQYPPRPMPQQTYQPGYQQAWHHQQQPNWNTGQLPFGGQPTGGHTATVQQPRDTGRGRKVALIAATVVLALGAGIGGGFLGADMRTSGSASALTAANASHSLTQATTSEQASSNAPAGSIEAVAADVLPSVVSILATSQSTGGEGSGVILTADGYILTNNHVVEGATDLTVRFNDGTTATATLVGADTTGDLAVIKVDGVSGLKAATLGTSGDLAVGEGVIAIGSPLGLSATVTSGIVSALNRPVRTTSSDTQSEQQQNPFGSPGGSPAASSGTVLNAIQTDASINPGNSGGALVNMSGQIIGINSAIASLSSGSSESGSIGVGFAIPIDTASRIAQEIIDTGKASHAVLGATVGDTTDSAISTGALISAITAGGAAETAGLETGDVVTKIDDNLIESADALVATIRSAAPGSEVSVTVLRGSSTETVNVTLGTATN